MKNNIPLVALAVLSLIINGCYLVKQGKGQLELRFKQIPIEEAVKIEKNPKFRQLLLAVPKIKDFAVKTVRLKKNSNYSGYFATSKKGIISAVTASQKDQLIPYTWWFPIIGSVPYKGFFNQEDARELEIKLQSEGYDTWLFTSNAYSSLGWFKDPVTTPMLRNGYYNLTKTIIHEMTHVTLYVDGKGDFNEQLASFVAQKAAFQYLLSNGILDENQVEKLKLQQKKRKVFARTVHKFFLKLKVLYDKHYPLAEVLPKREIIFSELTDEIMRIYPQWSKENWKFNNARILQYRRYEAEMPLFQELWEQSKHDWEKFWMAVRTYANE